MTRYWWPVPCCPWCTPSPPTAQRRRNHPTSLPWCVGWVFGDSHQTQLASRLNHPHQNDCQLLSTYEQVCLNRIRKFFDIPVNEYTCGHLSLWIVGHSRRSLSPSSLWTPECHWHSPDKSPGYLKNCLLQKKLKTSWGWAVPSSGQLAY